MGSILDRARELLEVAIRVVNELQPISRPWVMGTKAEVHLLTGEIEAARSAVQQTQVELLPEPLRSGAAIRLEILRGRIAAAEGDLDEAVRIATEVLERLRGMGVRPFVPEALLMQGTSLAALGRRPEAERVLREARSEAEALGHRRVLWEILRELNAVRAAEGDLEEAGRLRGEAGRIVREIAETVEDERLRSSFLARPEVKVVLPHG